MFWGWFFDLSRVIIFIWEGLFCLWIYTCGFYVNNFWGLDFDCIYMSGVNTMEIVWVRFFFIVR